MTNDFGCDAQYLHQPIDLFFAVVAMRADADAAKAMIDDDGLLPAGADQRPRFGTGNDQGHDIRFVLGPAAAVNGEPRALCLLTEIVCQMQDPVADGWDADFQKQL